MSNAKANLYDIKWQSLRVSLLGKFVSLIGMKQNIDKLEDYLDDSIPDTYGRFIKLWRIINLLNGVRMGFNGMGLVGTKQDDELVKFRSDLQDEYKSLKEKGFEFDPVNWDKVKKDLEIHYKSDKQDFNKVYENLVDRTDFAKKKVGTLKFRDSLTKFLSLMKAIKESK